MRQAILPFKNKLSLLKLIPFILLLQLNNLRAQINWYENSGISDLRPTRYLSVGFAAQNLKSITSMFGHSFLVFHDQNNPRPSDLIIEFRGVMGKTKFDYIKALFGNLEGKYDINNFIYKIREYHSDGRDIWLYKLKVNSSQIESLIVELKSRFESKWTYSFLSRNCSYYINQVILNTIKQKDEGSFVTIPIQSIRSLQYLNLLEAQNITIQSEQNFLNYQIKKLPLERQKQMEMFYQKHWPVKSSTEIEDHIINNLLNVKILQTDDESSRNELFRLKKKNQSSFSITSQKLDDPLDFPGDSYISMSISTINQMSLRMSVRGAQRSYLTNQKDNYRFTRFEIFRPVAHLTKNQIILDEFNLVTIEAISEKNFFFKRNDFLFDLSFYNWSPLGHGSMEEVFRTGLGKSIFLNDFSMSVFPYLGLRKVHLEDTSFITSDQGIKFIAQFNPHNSFSSKYTWTRYLFSPFEFQTLHQLETSYRLSKYFTSFLRGEMTSHNLSKHSFAEIGIAYLY